MKLLHADFAELYQRHLCRHSQYGINVAHIATLLGTYFAIFGIVTTLTATPWAVAPILIAYWLALTFSTPIRVLAVTILCTSLLFLLFLALPPLPVWMVAVYAVAIFVLYKLQAWSHKVYTVERDITEFNRKYPKGFGLFVLLSLYELPLLMNYLNFDRALWKARGVEALNKASPSTIPETVNATTDSHV